MYHWGHYKNISLFKAIWCWNKCRIDLRYHCMTNDSDKFTRDNYEQKRWGDGRSQRFIKTKFRSLWAYGSSRTQAFLYFQSLVSTKILNMYQNTSEYRKSQETQGPIRADKVNEGGNCFIYFYVPRCFSWFAWPPVVCSVLYFKNASTAAQHPCLRDICFPSLVAFWLC